MKLSCPSCGFVSDVEGFLSDAQWREALACAFKLPAPLGDRLVRYIRLFSPPKRGLSPDRAAKLLRELLQPIAEAAVERQGRKWSAPLDYWGMALDDMLERRDKLTLPLKSHGYLFEIVAGYSNKAEGKAEAKTEQTRQYAYSRPSTTSTAGLTRVAPPPEFLAMVKQLRKEKADDDSGQAPAAGPAE